MSIERCQLAKFDKQLEDALEGKAVVDGPGGCAGAAGQGLTG